MADGWLNSVRFYPSQISNSGLYLSQTDGNGIMIQGTAFQVSRDLFANRWYRGEIGGRQDFGAPAPTAINSDFESSATGLPVGTLNPAWIDNQTAPTDGSPPSSPPSGSYASYIVTIECPYNPSIPAWVEDRIRSVCGAGGWNLSYIRQTAEGYEAQITEVGSVTIIIVLGLIAAALALIGVIVIRAQAVEIEGNKTAQINSDNVKSSIQTITDFCAANGLSPSECEALIKAVGDVYGSATQPPPSSGGDVFDKLQPLLYGALAIAAVSALKK